MSSEQAVHCYRIADLVNGAFGSCYYELSEAQAALCSAIDEGTEANMELIGIDDSITYTDINGAREDASKFLFLCVVEQDGTLTAI